MVIFIAAAALAWWLSGYDSQVIGENKRDDLIRRGVRCGATAILVAIGLLNAYLMIFMIVAIAVLWAGCVGELFARGFHVFVDSPDNREYDPKQSARELNRLSTLVREGRNEEAIALCRHLLDMPGVSAMTIDTMLLHLYREKYSDDRITAMTEFTDIRVLREQRRFADAAKLLEQSLQKDSANLPASLLLMQIYAKDLQNPPGARTVLYRLSQTGLPPGFADYANERINEWSRGASEASKSTEGIESLLAKRANPAVSLTPIDASSASLDELLAAGHLATVIEILEGRIQAAPNDFESRLKLAEAQGVYCGNWLSAGKIVEKIATSRVFSPEQVRTAKTKLAAWKTSRQAK